MSRIREQFSTTALILSIMALVFAMLGGAYAATGSGGGKATASKAKAGPRGKTGKTGPAGPAGPQGPAGANGTNGSNGTSATTEVFSGNAHGCTEGGVIVKSASPEAIVCNGKKGTNGTTGFTEFLPPGKTETGAFGIQTGELYAKIPISFPIPLKEPLEGRGVSGHIINLAGEEATVEEAEVDPAEVGACLGTAENPTAEPGNLCIYVSKEQSAYPFANGLQRADNAGGEGEVGLTGDIWTVVNTGASEELYGTWAVTAPEG